MAQTALTTAYSYIPTAIARSIANVCTLRNRVPQGALVRLERYESKGSRTVLRGGDGGNAVFLPDISAISRNSLIVKNTSLSYLCKGKQLFCIKVFVKKLLRL